MNDYGSEEQAKQPGAVPRDPPDQQADAELDMWGMETERGGDETEDQQETDTEAPVPQEPTD